MNDIYQTLSAAKSLPEMCEIFELPELAAKARLLLPCLPTKKRSRSEVVEGNVEKSGLQPDHRSVKQ